MKKLLAILLCITLLAGCGRQVANVSQRLMVYAIGIDKSEDGYTVSYQVFSPTGENISSPVNADETNVKVISVSGTTIYECERLAELQSGKELFTQDVEAIILGSNIADGDLYDILGYFEGSPEVYMGTDIILSSGTAKEAVGIGMSGLSDPHGFGEIIDEATKQATAISSRLAEISNRIESSGSFILPILKIAYDDEGYPYAEGIFEGALYVEGEYIRTVGSDFIKGIRLLSGTAEEVSLGLTLDGKAVGAECSSLKIKRRAEDGIIHIEIEGEIAPYDIRKKSDSGGMITAAEDELRRLCCKAFETAAELNADLFDASLLFGRYGCEYEGMSAVQLELEIALRLY